MFDVSGAGLLLSRPPGPSRLAERSKPVFESLSPLLEEEDEEGPGEDSERPETLYAASNS